MSTGTRGLTGTTAPRDRSEAGQPAAISDVLLSVTGLNTHVVTPAGVAKAVDDVSFSVRRGEVVGLVGESGSGKSMTAYSILGLVDPPGRVVGGRIVFDGRDLATLGTGEMRQLRGNRIAMIFQDPMLTLNPVLRIDTQMVEAILAHQRISTAEALQRAREGLVKVGIASPDPRLRAYPHELSGGMRQRVAIAIALLNRPDLVIADEPTTALDATIQGQILYELQKLTREAGAALIWITHDLSVISGLADRVCVMYAGRIVEQGATADVLGSPRHPYTRGLLDSIPANAEPRERLKPIPGMLPPLTELPSGCAFRPRCPYATAECGEIPPVRPYGAVGQSIRCFHPLSPPAASR
ncbi:MAG TPA: ABC transporter ATP-binding protein [Casimicrobiaceae bacterium]